jgi:hypothetical protein
MAGSPRRFAGGTNRLCDPRGIDKPNTPDEEPAPWCKPSAGNTWSSDSRGGKPDFSGKSKDD